ncbi:hypothetical protein GCM10010345_90860 [Streptomyces canarius]|uniref:Uncharacterized protein n=1 Tax=Streptomyces canarius TaxID=285453 RepID=A0ABQ3DCD6_9ACTN|nr:hypothetical protein GCM10010345_90860 [Streptomyces canarius]
MGPAPGGGAAALASTGPPKLPEPADDRFADLGKELSGGPAVHRWKAQPMIEPVEALAAAAPYADSG